MIDILKGYVAGDNAMEPYNPNTRTVTEKIQDRLAYHKGEIVKLEEALAALTPDIERALNALSKL